MRILAVLVALILILAVSAAVYFRLVSMPVAVWHVDPAGAAPLDSPNFELRQGAEAPLIPAPIAEVAARLDAVAAEEGAQVIAGAASEGFVTYVARSRLMGYPDAISIRLTEDGDATRVDIFSRSRFGYSDMGVNAARVARWIDAATP